MLHRQQSIHQIPSRDILDFSQGNLTKLELELGCVSTNCSRNFTVDLLHDGVGGAELENLEQGRPKQALSYTQKST